MTKSRALRLVVAIALAAGFISGADQTEAMNLEPDCRVSIDAPHLSSGAGGIISKGRYRCDKGVNGTVEDVRISLYTGCDKPLPATKPFTRFDCDEITTEAYGTASADDRNPKTFYVPRPGQAHDNVAGYHRAYIEWQHPGSGQEFKAGSIQISGAL